MKVIEKTKSTTHTQAKPISLSPLDFEQALESILKIKPVENKSLTKKKEKQKTKARE